MNKETKVKERENTEFPISHLVLLYESKDGRLCLFKDANGHLTAVRSERLA